MKAKHGVLLGVLVIGSMFQSIRAQYAYESIKAALIYQLTHLTNFPNQPDKSQFEVGFLGDPKTSDEFTRITSHAKIQNLSIKVRSFKRLEDLTAVNVLIVSPAFNPQIKKLWDTCSDSRTLLITENVEDLQFVMINLRYIKQLGKITFEINNSNLLTSGFSVEPELLLLGGKEVDIVDLFKEMRDSMASMDQKILIQKNEIESELKKLDQQERAITANYLKIDRLNMQLDSILEGSRRVVSEYNRLSDSLQNQTLRYRNLTRKITEKELFADSLNQLILSYENQGRIKEALLDSLNRAGLALGQKLLEQEDILSSKEEMIRLQQKSLNLLTLFGISLVAILILIFLAFRNKRLLSVKLAQRVDEKTQELQRANLELLQTSEGLEDSNRELVRAIHRAEESDRLKSAFIANISHEIRTPLNSILGFTELLSDPDLTDTQKKKYIELVQGGGSQLLSIIGNIINISLIESGELELNKEKIELDEFIQNTLLKFQQLNTSDRIDLKAITDKKIQIFTDKDRLNQILDNLVGNALKYTEEGCITLSYDRLDAGWVQFSVQDTGIGIPEETGSKVFDRFYRERKGTKIVSGTGLGLSITKSLVEIMGGEVWFKPAPDRGTTFFFKLPAE